ncbi:hypothetical protein [Duncaniella muris]|jgi:hypothetical protein|uniref:hypothetical protein n=1 Tax=Duncaniella muris TaxID=2094150 RepID=UPI002676EED4|nr:hypothetical protein [Duncaniella muris]
MATVVNVNVPKGWAELSQQQLRFLLTTMVTVNRDNTNVGFRSQEDYALHIAAQVQTICFFKWSGLTVVCPYDSGYLVRSGDIEFMLSAETVAAALSHLSWTKELPAEPIRLDTVDGANAIPADISSGLSFDAWLACDTLWQRYQICTDETLLRQMAEILYNKENIKMTAAETLGIFYWWAGVKNLVSAMFPNFFKPAAVDSEPTPPSYDELRRNIDAQIRALTKGDITKEKEILALDAMRALTELDAQAREYDEIRKKYPSK